ncbi:MAG: hypothetical protein JSW47_02095 [Phycisphaerales bacterium]|nr:MAG: hypothetical protein JSW47_02095 [Phycisphaerales bacterium]
MKQFGIYGLAFAAMSCIFLLANGCSAPSKGPVVAEEQDQSVKLALKFVPGDSTSYKVALETGKSVEWEGQAPRPKGFKGGHTSSKMEMTFSQQIETIGEQGDAVARITIEGLKYVTTIKDNAILDFDSSRDKGEDHPLNNLIGRSYTIAITPSGEVSRIIDTSDALAAVSADKTAVALLSADAIRQRHAVPALPATGENQLRPGEDWSNVKSVSFDMMGAKSYERIYTLKEIKDVDNRRVAVVGMDAFPSAARAKELHKGQSIDLFSHMSDSTEDYAGELKLDLTEGKVAEYKEKLVVEWLIVDPNPKKDKPPAALKIAATRLFGIERMD